MKVAGLLIAPIIVALILLAVHFLFMPLDVLWYVAIRRLGL